MANRTNPNHSLRETASNGASRAEDAEKHEAAAEYRSLMSSGLLIGGVALIEPELLVGMAIGAGIVLVSPIMSELVTDFMRPLVKSTVKAGYGMARTLREIVAEATEEAQDAIAEASAELQKAGASAD